MIKVAILNRLNTFGYPRKQPITVTKWPTHGRLLFLALKTAPSFCGYIESLKLTSHMTAVTCSCK